MGRASVISTPFQRLPSADLGNATTEATFKSSETSNPVIVLRIPSRQHMKWKAFRVGAAGRVEGGTTTNFTLALQSGTSATFTDNTDLVTSTARAVDSAKHNWQIETKFYWDSDSQKLQGVLDFIRIGNAAINTAAVLTQITGVNLVDGTGIAGFVITGLFSASSAGNHAYLDEFVVEEI